jgi:excisionase family DNA binding protein
VDDPLLTVTEVAELARVEPETVRRWLRQKQLRGALLSRKGGWRVRQSDLDAFLQDHMNLPEPRGEDEPTTDYGRVITVPLKGVAMNLQQALDSSAHGVANADLRDALGSHCRVARKPDGSLELTTRAAGLSTLFDVTTFATLNDLFSARPYLAKLDWQPA